ncbi:DUF1173 family protein [Nocardia sp. CA-120079]|uniref:DUF1173 family protein n=1 Tax=Nocardia sp. CA-120079 TaxID=3239974 RepID=UPI003D97147D
MSAATLYTVLGRPATPSDPQWQTWLAEARRAGVRPRCMCTREGTEMYIATIGDRHLIVKRMPGSAAAHAPGCESYEPPPELSGLGQLLGGAIEEDNDETRLKLAFALSMNTTARAPVGDSEPGDSVTADPSRLTLRGTLHYLWEQAGFTRWVPAMAGKRNWYVVRKHLLAAASDKTTKGAPLAQSLYLPPPFDPNRKTELAARRSRVMGSIADTGRGRRRLLFLIGEVASITEGRLGHKLVLNESPDYPFLLPDDLHKRMTQRFATELELWAAADEQTRLIIAGTISANRSGVATLHELTLMTVTDNWIPYESIPDRVLLDHLTERSRSFAKSLRYNLASSKALAAAVLTDTDPATALYIVSGDQHRDAVDELIAESDLPSWVWDTGPDLPSLPALRVTGSGSSLSL